MPVQLVPGRLGQQRIEGGIGGGVLGQSRIEATYVIYQHAYLAELDKVTANAVQPDIDVALDTWQKYREHIFTAAV